MTNGKLTYQELFDALRGLGYQRRDAMMAGRPGIIFSHPKYPRAEIYLPPPQPGEEVAPRHIIAVRVTLREHGIIGDDPGRALMDMIAAKQRASHGD